MQEKSIEKDEEILNNIKAYMQENIDKGYHKFVYNDLGYDEKCIDVINAIEHILSDYKRVLKENEELLEVKVSASAHNRIMELEEENKQLEAIKDEAIRRYNFESIPKSKLKEFFSSRLEKYQEADDGKYEQDYLTRGELELVDRYKECKEIAKIILEEEINSEVPQNCIPTSLVEDKIKELNSRIEKYREYVELGIETDIEWVDNVADRKTVKVLQELLEESE